jgi:hypothetical protein
MVRQFDSLVLTVHNTAAHGYSLAEIDSELRARFGTVMSTEEVASALKMSVAALRMARSRKQLSLAPLEVQGRRGQIYLTADVARLLTSWVSRRREAPM